MATFTVTNLFDSGSGSLRDSISTANTTTGADIIDFDTDLSGGTIGLTSGELGISDNLTINGLGAEQLSVDAGGNPFRVFNVDNGNSDNSLEVAIDGLTITGGLAGSYAGDGGGILNQENLTVTNSTISGNDAGGFLGFGGGIANFGDLMVTNSTISDNMSGSGSRLAGGIFNYEGTLTVTNSTISGNDASGSGGGIVNDGGVTTVTNSTVSGNTANYIGGGISNRDGTLTVSNSTVSNNSSGYIGSTSYTGGGISNYEGTLTVTNSTISGNSAESVNSSGGIYNNGGDATVTSSIIADNTNNQDVGGSSPFTSEGNNLIGNGDGATGFTNGVNGDLVGTTANPIDPLLGELQDNGGSTLTQALLPGSPAINAGSNPLNLQFDQRGPGFGRTIGSQTDIGAVEVPEPDSTLGVLGVAVLGAALLRKRQRLKKNNLNQKIL